MKIEYEATFENIDKNEIRKRLQEANAELVRPEFLQKRSTFSLPEGYNAPGVWARVRDEGDKITMSLKSTEVGKIDGQKEICLKVDNMQNAEKFLELIGCNKKAYQENKREFWKINDVEITIDEWPFLEPFVEIEGNSENVVKKISKILGFNYESAFFGSVSPLYAKKYNISEEIINNKTPRIIFDMENPFKS